jgi:hypothetical protein
MSPNVPLKTQFESVATWWCWSQEDRTTWAAWAKFHLEDASEFIRMAYQDTLNYRRLGYASADEMFAAPTPT